MLFGCSRMPPQVFLTPSQAVVEIALPGSPGLNDWFFATTGAHTACEQACIPSNGRGDASCASHGGLADIRYMLHVVRALLAQGNSTQPVVWYPLGTFNKHRTPRSALPAAAAGPELDPERRPGFFGSPSRLRRLVHPRVGATPTGISPAPVPSATNATTEVTQLRGQLRLANKQIRQLEKEKAALENLAAARDAGGATELDSRRRTRSLMGSFLSVAG